MRVTNVLDSVLPAAQGHLGTKQNRDRRKRGRVRNGRKTEGSKRKRWGMRKWEEGDRETDTETARKLNTQG